MSRLAQAEPRPHCVYKHYDTAGVLLYVGCCAELGKRTYAHAIAAWAAFADRVEGQWYPDYRTAKDAETAAIREGAPLFNVHGYAPGHEPDEAERHRIAQAYLRKRGHRRRRTKNDVVVEHGKRAQVAEHPPP